MRRILKGAAAALAALLAAIQLARPDRTNPPSDPALAIEGRVPMPPEVAGILSRACADCHSNRTEWPWYSHVAPVSWFVAGHVSHARRHLDFSRWGSYEPRRAAGLTENICRLVRSGAMPLSSYWLLHPRARLSAEEIGTLCAWSRSESARRRSGQAVAPGEEDRP